VSEYGKRDYGPDWGRWGNRDPIEEDGGRACLYAACHNNAISAYDALGLSGLPIELGLPWGEDWRGIEERGYTRGRPPRGLHNMGEADHRLTLSCECRTSFGPYASLWCKLIYAPVTDYAIGYVRSTGVTGRDHEANHTKVYENVWLPTLRSLFPYYGLQDCCNCDERKTQFIERFWQLEGRLDTWDYLQEFGPPRVSLRPEKEPFLEYGGELQVLYDLVREVMSQEQIPCK